MFAARTRANFISYCDEGAIFHVCRKTNISHSASAGHFTEGLLINFIGAEVLSYHKSSKLFYCLYITQRHLQTQVLFLIYRHACCTWEYIYITNKSAPENNKLSYCQRQNKTSENYAENKNRRRSFSFFKTLLKTKSKSACSYRF